jgi:cobalt-zinc-cadmium efflux system protein
MGHDHHDHGGHAHGSHGHGATSYGVAFGVGIALNTAFTAVEAVYGIVAGSMALVADAVHNFGDVLGLALAWAAFIVAKRPPSKRRTYGMRKATVLAALGNSTFLLVATGGVAWEAIGRLRQPSPVEGGVMIGVAAFGVVINGVSAALFLRGRDKDINVRSAFLHLASDAVVALGVVLAGAAIHLTHLTWIDPAASHLVSAVILIGTWKLLRESVHLALDSVPEGIDMDAIDRYFASLPGVVDVHDLHVWPISTTETALTVHLVTSSNSAPTDFLDMVETALHERFRIDHSTLQLEGPEAHTRCRRARVGSI